jgi:hypothetical protein
MHVEFYTLENLPPELNAFWQDAIERQDRISAFTSGRRWFSLMSGDEPDARLLVACRGEDESCRLLMPLMEREWSLDLSLLGKIVARRALKVFKAGGGDLIHDGIEKEDLSHTVRDLFSKRPDIDALWFEHVSGEDRYQKIEACARGAGCFVHAIFRNLPHFRFVLPPTWDECKASRSSKSLGRIRSKENALSRELGEPLELVELRTRDEWQTHAERIESLVDQSWQSQLFGQRFRVSQVQGSADAGYLRGFLLMAGNRAIAFTLYYYGEETMISGILAYDRSYGKHSPGTVLFLKTLEHLYANDPPRYLDFGEGDADYKRQWSNDEIAGNSVLLVKARPSLRLAFAFHRGCNGLNRLVRGMMATFGLDRLLVKRLKRAARE